MATRASGVGSAPGIASTAPRSESSRGVGAPIEERGAEIGNAQSAMAVSVFFWTIGFASGGLLASFALAGASSAARAQAVLAALGAANVAVALAVVARLRGKA